MHDNLLNSRGAQRINHPKSQQQQYDYDNQAYPNTRIGGIGL